MLTELTLQNLPTSDQRLDAMFQAFDDLMLVLDEDGRILDYKAGSGSALYAFTGRFRRIKFQDIVPLEVKKKYEEALQELKNGSKVVLFEYRLPTRTGDIWHESRLVPFTKGQSIMFVRNITRHKQSSDSELTLAYDKTIEGWSRTLYLRDQETEDHARRVTETTLRLAHRLGLSEAELVHIRRGAILHDIGKVAIPDHILFKPGPLTGEEWVIMRRHPSIAMEILKPIAYLAPALSIPYSHHEKWDGSGYPDRLDGEDIPLAARIFAFADVYDALTSDRPYRGAWTKESAIAYVLQNAGTHFDPKIAPVFVEMLKG